MKHHCNRSVSVLRLLDIVASFTTIRDHSMDRIPQLCELLHDIQVRLLEDFNQVSLIHSQNN